jgi:hypothetical protein
MERRDLRRQVRSPSLAPAKVRWCGSGGEWHFARGKIVNSSPNGVCIELPEPIKPPSYVTLDAPALDRADWAGGASVRYCWPKGAKYLIGLELATTKWKETASGG